MNSLKASLELWLKLQCQMQPKVTQAILAREDDNTQCHVLAQWPNSHTITRCFSDAFAEVSQKKRIHLSKIDKENILLGQPVVINGNYFGAVILNFSNCNSQEIKSMVEVISRGLAWLQFLFHEDLEGDAPQPNIAAITTNTGINNNAITQPNSLIESLLKENSPQEAAISLVNILAAQFHCARVSLGWQTSSGVSLDAVSFSANFDARTPAMLLLIDTMNEACDQGVNIGCSLQDENSGSSATIKRNHKELLQQQSLQSVQSLLLRNEKKIVGVITLETSQAGSITQEQHDFIQSQLPLITRILELKKNAAAGLWHKIKQLTQFHINRGMGDQRIFLKAIGILCIVFIALLFIPIDYQISGDANLKSAYKHLLVSPQDGYLKAIKVRPGDLVKKGDLLAQLNDDELSLQRRKLASQVQQYQQEYDTALANSDRVAAAITDTQVEQANIQLRLIEQQLDRIQLLAPSDGIVVSDDISQSLGAPVKQGDMLFEIAAAQGYLVQLMVDERDISELKIDQIGHVKLTSLPHETFEVTVKRITPLSEILNGRNNFKIEATLNRGSTALRPGMTGTGKVVVGTRRVGWIWFHDLWHWFCLKIWW